MAARAGDSRLTQEDTETALAPAGLGQAFEHSITGEDDIWRADPVDVEAVHAAARRKFEDLLSVVTGGRGSSAQGRILLFHGQSGAGKTHLIRALRTSAHRRGKAYFGYAQMTPDIADYAGYYLRRLIASLERPYDPDAGGESGLARLTRLFVGEAEIPQAELTKLRDAKLDDKKLAKLVHELADGIIASPKYQDRSLDVNIVRALLYLQRADPRIDQRVRQYLQGRPLNELSLAAVAALDPNDGDGRAFEIIEALGQLMWSVDRAALVFCIDQVEDLRFFPDAEERFQRAARDLIQVANRMANAITIISCLEDFYGQMRGVLAQSYVDRIEKAGPVALHETRTPEEARLIIEKRLAHEADTLGAACALDPVAFLGEEFFEEFGGLSTRRLLEHAQTQLRAKIVTEPGGDAQAEKTGFISKLADALGFFGSRGSEGAAEVIDYRNAWERHQGALEPDMPGSDAEFMDLLGAALKLAREEWEGIERLDIGRPEIADDLPVIDVALRHKTGLSLDGRVFLCNRATQGGGLKRQLDRVLPAMQGKTCFMLRAADFPPNRKNQTAQAFRKFRESGGRSILVPIPDWERMIAVREFHAHHRRDPGFGKWFGSAKLLSNRAVVAQLLRLDLLGRTAPRLVHDANEDASSPREGRARSATGHEQPSSLASALAALDLSTFGAPWPTMDGEDAEESELPLAVILDENATGQSSILAGRETDRRAKPITLNTSVLKRHSAVLGGSGSGKTTLALCLIEQLLMRGIPAVLIDRKGDLCSYANPDVWRAADSETERRGERAKLADAIDVAVYTPGRASGRPISITLLPNGINELPDHEQQLLANLSAAALGDMLHLKNSATHQKQWGTLSVALRLLGMRHTREVMLGDLIDYLEAEYGELTDQTQRMDPSGKIRRDLVAQLDSLRHRNTALFEGGGEPLRMDSLLGLGSQARKGRTRLSIIYTGFLGDNENILFWVAQFLSEALRFCQRNPNDALQAVVMFDEADLYIPATAKPATAEPLQSLLKRARSAGLGIMLATQSPGDLDYRSRDQITSWFIGRVREDTALRKLKAAFQSHSGLDPTAVLPNQTVGEFHLVQENLVRSMKAQKSLIVAEQVPFDRIEQLARETKGQGERQLRLFS